MNTAMNGATRDADKSEICPICAGMGYVTKNVPLGDPDFGKAFPCVCQADTIKNRKANQLLTLSHLENYADKTFATFEIDFTLLEPNEEYLKEHCSNKPNRLTPNHWSQLKNALEAAVKFAHDPDSAHAPRKWLLYWGTYGTGKTHLAAAIGNKLLEQGISVLFLTVPDLLDYIKQTYKPESTMSYEELFERVRSAPVLILDDLGTEKQSEWAQEKLYQLLNHRYVKRLPTVITTNVALEQIEPRIRSRLIDTALTYSIRLEIPDRRNPYVTWQDLDLTNLDRYRDMRFETWSMREDENLPESQLKWFARAVQAVHGYLEDSYGWLVLIGEPGSGKTHLAASLSHELKNRGEQVLFVTTSELLDHLRATFYPGSTVQFDRRFTEIKNASFVVFDDLIIDRNLSAWAYDKLFEILIYRFDNYLPTVITTYEPIKDMEVRLRSRVINEAHSQVVALTVPSYSGKRSKRAATPRMPKKPQG